MDYSEGLISVILPVFNREKYIEECIDSVLNQEYSNFEIIIVDDGSADQSPDICKKYAEKEPRIKFFPSEHNGVSGVRNLALSKAQGEYVFFMDSDDIIHPMLFKLLVEGMKQHNAAMGGTGVLSVNETYWEKIKEHCNKNVESSITYQNHEKSLEAIFNGNSPINMIGGVIMRRDLIGDTHFDTELFIGEDFYFIYKNLIKDVATVFINPKMYFARIHNENISHNYQFDGFWTRFHRCKMVWESEESFGRTKYANVEKKGAFYSYIRCILNTNDKSELKKMTDVIKQHKKTLLSAMEFAGKIRFYLYIYLPFARKLIYKTEIGIANIIKRLKGRT